MAKKLGRGLSHLIPTNDAAAGPVTEKYPEYQELPVMDIHPNPDQPRKRFSDNEIEELAKTLHTVGLIEPVIVRKVLDKFQLISGERRWRACQKAGFKKIPVIIKKLNDLQALEMGIIENIQREDLNPIEEARAYQEWIDKSGMKAAQLADKVGKDRTTVTNLLRLLKLPEQILTLIESKQITAGQARPLLSLGDKAMMHSIAKKIVIQGWSARRVEDEIARLTGEEQTPAEKAGRVKKSRGDANSRSLEEKLRKKLGAKTQVDHKKTGAGKISLHYNSLEDLDRLLDVLGIKG